MEEETVFDKDDVSNDDVIDGKASLRTDEEDLKNEVKSIDESDEGYIDEDIEELSEIEVMDGNIKDDDKEELSTDGVVKDEDSTDASDGYIDIDISMSDVMDGESITDEAFKDTDDISTDDGEIVTDDGDIVTDIDKVSLDEMTLYGVIDEA